MIWKKGRGGTITCVDPSLSKLLYDRAQCPLSPRVCYQPTEERNVRAFSHSRRIMYFHAALLVTRFLVVPPPRQVSDPAP